MEVYMKYKVIILVMAIMMSLTACVDFEKAAKEKNKVKEEEIKKTAALGDFDIDGRKDAIVVSNATIKLISAGEVIASVEPNPGLEYIDVNAMAADLDCDAIKEIVVIVTAKGDANVANMKSVYVLDRDDRNQYYVRNFPEELNQALSETGLTGEVKPVERYKYEITCMGNKFMIDVTNMYGLQSLTLSAKEEIEYKWDNILENGRKGQVLEINRAEVILINSNERYLRIYQNVRGADNREIGYLVSDICFNKNGAYEVKNVNYMELIGY